VRRDWEAKSSTRTLLVPTADGAVFVVVVVVELTTELVVVVVVVVELFAELGVVVVVVVVELWTELGVAVVVEEAWEVGELAGVVVLLTKVVGVEAGAEDAGVEVLTFAQTKLILLKDQEDPVTEKLSQTIDVMAFRFAPVKEDNVIVTVWLLPVKPDRV
jgi:hypothetical protein